MKYFLLFAVVLGVMPAIGALIGAHNERLELREWVDYIAEHECVKSPLSDHWWKCMKPTPYHIWKE